MKPEKQVTHAGKVVEVNGNIISIRVFLHESCGNCLSKAGCVIPSNIDNMIRISNKKARFKPGDPVKIMVSKKFNFLEPLLKYLLPAIILLAVFLVLNDLQDNFNSSAIYALIAILCYFLFYRFYLNKLLKQTIKYKIQEKESY